MSRQQESNNFFHGSNFLGIGKSKMFKILSPMGTTIVWIWVWITQMFENWRPSVLRVWNESVKSSTEIYQLSQMLRMWNTSRG